MSSSGSGIDAAGQRGRGPAARRTRRLQNRRGAMFALVALMLVMIVGMAAVAIDMGRLYVGAAELQTAADASALVGAQALQKATSNQEVVVPQAVAAFAPRNSVFKTPLTAAELEVKPKYWTPGVNGGPGSTADAAWSAANAVEVSAKRQSAYLLGQIFEAVAPQLSRPATAWVANINGAKCLRPWGFPMSSVLTRAGDDGDGVLSQAELNTINALSENDRTIRVTPPPKTGGGNTNTPPGEDGHWDPLRWKVPNNGMSGYQQNIQGACSGESVALNKIYDHPGSNIDDKTTEAVAGSGNGNGNKGDALCAFQGNSATCFDPVTGQAGVTMLVVYGTTTYKKGTEEVKVDMIGEFTLLCYQRGGKGNGNGNGNGKGGGGNDACASSKYPSMLNQPEGTMVGYIHPNVRKLGPDLILGNTLSIGQVLILVK